MPPMREMKMTAQAEILQQHTVQLIAIESLYDQETQGALSGFVVKSKNNVPCNSQRLKALTPMQHKEFLPGFAISLHAHQC